ncbi:MAG: hypothetical protein ACK5D5_04510 [Bacteroidota bacterium]
MHIKINEPSQMVRAQLLKHNFPEINTEQLYHLSHDYEFTAANLETFKQQKMIAGIVRKKQTNGEDDLQLFFQTLSSNGSRQNKIGLNYK